MAKRCNANCENRKVGCRKGCMDYLLDTFDYHQEDKARKATKLYSATYVDKQIDREKKHKTRTTRKYLASQEL